MRRALAAVVVAALATACGSTVQVRSEGRLGDAQGLGGGPGLGTTGTSGTDLGGTGGAAGSPGGTSGTAGPGSTGGSTGTTGGAGVLPGGSGGTTGSTSGGGASGVPLTGPGWDAKYVYIGVTTQKDVNTAAQSVGANGLNAGDQEGQAKAVISYLNARGGIFGRQIKPVFHDQSTVGTKNNPDNAGQVACTYFTQDHKVIAVLNPVTLMDVDSFRGCLAKKKVPLFSASVAPVSQGVAARYAPYFYQSVASTWDALAPALVRQLKAFGYFDSGWNTSTGTSVPGKAKVGILTPDTADGIRTAQLLDQQLAKVGSKAVQTFRFDPNNTSTMSSAVLQFRGNGVDHVIATDASLFPFQLQAGSQGYRPRYGVHSINAPVTFLQTNGGPSQNKGDVGVGWAPTLDVDDAHDPGSFNASVPLCYGIMKKGGQTYGRDQRLGRAVALAFCDGLRLIAEGAKAGGGMTGLQIYHGMLKVAPTFASAFSFAPGLRPGRLTIPGGVRPLAFDDACACFRYTSTTTTPL